ncbi:MAG: thioredoxin family protein [Desulfobacteraceae bacterium]|nr:thioredoxin family protein [Desulfobacteraceae bacterium]
MRFKLSIMAVLFFWISSSAVCKTIDWKSYDEALGREGTQGKKIFLHFRTDWCRYCTQMDQETFGHPLVVSFLSEHFIAVKVDGDREKEAVKQHQVSGYPDNRFLDEKGREVYRLPGFVEPEVFLFFLEYIQTGSYQTMDPMQFYKSR